MSFQEALEMPRKELMILAEIRADSIKKNPSYGLDRELSKM
ncbi:MAG: hypothetical protein ACRCXX_05780 [Cetobacterium sp.]